jgi:hypothetical protein
VFLVGSFHQASIQCGGNAHIARTKGRSDHVVPLGDPAEARCVGPRGGTGAAVLLGRDEAAVEAVHRFWMHRRGSFDHEPTIAGECGPSTPTNPESRRLNG